MTIIKKIIEYRWYFLAAWNNCVLLGILFSFYGNRNTQAFKRILLKIGRIITTVSWVFLALSLIGFFSKIIKCI